MAEYLSMGRVDHLTEMWLRDGALQGYLIPLDVSEPGQDIRIYRYGQAILAYLGARGSGTTGSGRSCAGPPVRAIVEKAFQDVLGLTLEKFSEDWMEAVRKTYLPQIRDHKKPEDFALRLTNSEKDLSSYYLTPAVSPDGDRWSSSPTAPCTTTSTSRPRSTDRSSGVSSRATAGSSSSRCGSSMRRSISPPTERSSCSRRSWAGVT